MGISEQVAELERENKMLRQKLEDIRLIADMRVDGDGSQVDYSPNVIGPPPTVHGTKIVVVEWKNINSQKEPLILSEPIEVTYNSATESWENEKGDAFPDGLRYALTSEIFRWHYVDGA